MLTQRLTTAAIPIMEKEWPQFDWSTVDPQYPAKTGIYEFSKDGLTQRGIAARKWLRDRPEKVIAVVSHSGFLRVGVSYRDYANADFRIFDFSQGDEEIGGTLVEWESTEKKGGGLGKSSKGIFPMGVEDYPQQTEKVVGEVVDEKPS
jgi:broad specificity phosphatase PhoE